MPITQDRMISALNAARDYKQAFEHVVKYILEQDVLARTGANTAQESLNNILMRATPEMLLVHPIQSAETVASEYAHFKAVAKRNDASRKRMQRQRGIEPDLTSATNFLHTNERPQPRQSTAPRQAPRAPELYGSIAHFDDDSGNRGAPGFEPFDQNKVNETLSEFTYEKYEQERKEGKAQSGETAAQSDAKHFISVKDKSKGYNPEFARSVQDEMDGKGENPDPAKMFKNFPNG